MGIFQFNVSLMVVVEYDNILVVNMKYRKKCDMSLSCRKLGEIAPPTLRRWKQRLMKRYSTSMEGILYESKK